MLLRQLPRPLQVVPVSGLRQPSGGPLGFSHSAMPVQTARSASKDRVFTGKKFKTLKAKISLALGLDCG